GVQTCALPILKISSGESNFFSLKSGIDMCFLYFLGILSFDDHCFITSPLLPLAFTDLPVLPPVSSSSSHPLFSAASELSVAASVVSSILESSPDLVSLSLNLE